MKQIIFIFGPSGVGKSYLSKKLKKKKFLYVHIDTDCRNRTFAANGFPSEWDENYHKVDYSQMVDVLQNHLDDEYKGVIVSFPTVYVFTYEKLIEIEQLGVTPLVLWGKYEDCIRAAEMRIKKKGMEFNLRRYNVKNILTFQTYCRPEYDAFRVEAFQKDGSRYPNEKWLTLIMERTSG